ncbi:histone-lysine N-methyltransferase SETMAR [Trichonephila clavipes]|nr:histone-lysine N-methyltransferase SETMAR [Trichonephila clavipes]
MNAYNGCNPCRATVFRWFKEFYNGHNSLQDEEHTGRPRPAKILQEVNVRGIMIHYASATSHTAGLTAEFLKQKQIKVIEHPPYSPDLAMSDFWLFINLKKNLRGCRFHSEEDIDVAINAFFHQFQEMNG